MIKRLRRRNGDPPTLAASSRAWSPERYAVLATALGGRRLAVVTGAEFPYTDGETIFVTEDGPVRVPVIVHALLVGNGSLSRTVLGELRGKPDRARRFLLLEVNRLCVDDSPWSSLRRVIGVPDGVPETSGSVASLELALGTTSLPQLPVAWGRILPAKVVRNADDELDSEPNPATARNHSRQDRTPEVDEDDSEDAGAILRALSSPFGSTAMRRLLQNLLGMGGSRGKKAGDGAAEGDEPSDPRSAAQPVRESGSSALRWGTTTGGAVRGAPARAVLFPEWDVGTGSYRPDWCTVIERSPDLTDEPADPSTTGRDEMMRRRLVKIGLSPQMLLRQPVGDDLDLDAVVRAQIATASGANPDENVYAEARPRRRELSVLVLLDVSGSTKDTSPAGGTVYERQREAAASLIGSLNSLGARTACYAFHSRGRHAVHALQVKTFEETWNRQVPMRFSGLRPGAYTRLGAAVRYGVAVLASEVTSKRRLLLVISDGLPYDNDYEGAYAEADVRRALEEARSDTIGCLCISVGAANRDGALANVFGAAAHADLPDIRALREMVATLFLHGLKTSDPRRRVSQRSAVA